MKILVCLLRERERERGRGGVKTVLFLEILMEGLGIVMNV